MNKKLQKIGGISSLLEALIYISAFIVYGGVLVFPASNATTVERFGFLSDNYLLLSILNLTSYVLFGILLAVLVLAVDERLKQHSPVLSRLAAAFGLIWVGLVIASGMIANVGLNYVVGHADAEQAMAVWSSVGVVSEGLGGGNEVVGGIWVLLLSLTAVRGQSFSKPVNYIGVLVGIAGILTIYPLDLFTEIFGLGQIVWFLWLGVLMLKD